MFDSKSLLWHFSVLFMVVFLLALPNSSSAFPLPTNPVPQLDPIVPGAVRPGTASFTLTLTGTGFVSSSIVRWNGSSLPTTFVSSSKLSAAVPGSDLASANTASINVYSPGPGGGFSNSQVFEATTFIAQLFFTPLSVTGENNLTSPVVGADFNGDGKADIAVASGSNVYALLGNNDGSFQNPKGSPGPAGGSITGLKVAPFYAYSQFPSLIVTGSKGTHTSFVATMFGTGDGTFQSPIETDFTAAIPPTAVTGDFNGDGNLDLAFATATGVQVLLGNGNGTFQLGPFTPITQIGRDTVAVGDFNHDGNLDLVVTVFDPYTAGYNFAGILLGNGDGTFATLNEIAGSGTSYAGAITAVAGDFNGDGNLDIATAIQSIGQLNQGYVFISLGNGDGSFQSSSMIPNVNSITTPLLVADFNGDGFLDLATGGTIYFGRGDGSFPTYTRSTTAPSLVLPLDVNGDGLPDLIDETSYISGSTVLTSIGVELQTPPQPDFKGVVAPFNPTLAPGGSVTIPVTLEALNGWTGDVVVNASNLPNGLTPSYSPVVVTGGNGTCTIALTASNSVALGQYDIILSGNSGSLTHSTTAVITVTASPGDFTGSIPQTALDTGAGGSVAYTVNIQPLYGFTGNVSLNVAGLPAGTTATFNPPVLTGGSGTSTLTVQTSSLTPQPGISTLTVSATSGNLVHNTAVYLGVSSGSGDFTGQVNPSSQSVSSSGGTASFSIALTPINGGAGDVTLSVTGLPGNSVGTFSPTVVPGGSGSSTLTVNVPSGTSQGSYPLVVTCSGNGVIHVAGVTLTVTP
ncbi:MAG: FG-GAP-like repeat-containing protein [Candidatus Acidiferrum sp.]